MRYGRFAGFGLGLVLVSASAASGAELLPPPKDQVSFRVESTREVANDWLAATLGVDEEGNDAAELAARVNRRMAAALEIAKQDAELQVSSGAYQTQPVYDRSRIVRWRASQDLVVEGPDVEALTALAGRLQAQGLLLRGVAFSVSPEMQKRVEEELTVEALSAFRERAGLIARGLGRRGWNLMSLVIGEPGVPMPIPYGRAMAMEAADASVAPALESGKSTLRISIDATVEVE
jgi:predicted secreted protein